jgi:hypothetical protein
MDPSRVEFKEYLEKDAEYEWRFTNPLIKKQVRSVSFDMAQEYELAEGEYVPSR